MNWWQRLWRRDQMETQLEKELHYHLEQHTEELIDDGVSPDEARRRARLDLGGPEQVKQQCRDARGTRWVEDLGQDARFALRMLRKNPGFAAVALLTLALGTGATTVMFTLVNGVLLKPLSYPEPERLIQLHRKIDQLGEPWGYSPPDFRDYRRDTSSVAKLAAWSWGGGTITGVGHAEYLDGRAFSSDIFSVLGVQPERGRAFTMEEERGGGAPVVIISYRLWQRLYAGSEDAIGKQLELDGVSRTIVGVTPPHFDPDGEIDGKGDVFIPLEQDPDTRMAGRSANFMHALGRLEPGVKIAQANAELARIAKHMAEQYPEDAGVGAVAHPLQQDIVGKTGSTLWLLLGAVTLVLLIACVNVASLLLARAVSRERELAMRVALGAGRGRLIRQCLTESGILGLAGGLLGVVIAAAGIRPFLALWPGDLPRASDVQLDWRVLLVATGVGLLSGLMFGLAPALRAPTRDLEQKMRGGMRSMGDGSRRLHNGFVIAEIGLAVVLLVSAGMLGRTVLRLSTLDPGVRMQKVLTARMSVSPTVLQNGAATRAAYMNVLDRARAVPGVEAAALTDIVPLGPGQNMEPYWASAAEPTAGRMPLANGTTVTPDYLKVMGIPLRRGRFFTDNDDNDHPWVAVVDEVLAEHAFGSIDAAVGKQIHLPVAGSTPFQIIGVVAHVRHGGLAGDDQLRVRDQLYTPFAQLPDRLMHLFSTFLSITVQTSGPPLAMVDSLRLALRGTGDDQVLYQVRTMEELVSASLATQRFLLALFGVFAGLALLLACIGIYGVMAYLTAQRVPELGVRMALGATAGNVVWLVLRQSLALIFGGVAIGTFAASVAARAMVHSVAGMHQIEAVSFAVMIPVLVFAAAAASWIPARRASRIDPVRALRQE
ncbi:MAG: ABC transporter permease [Candidatus Acidiferrales bacterium]